jgi:hypothetical protein
MKKQADIFRLRFLLRNDEQIIVPMAQDGEVKSFIFHNSIVDINTETIAKSDFKEDLFHELTQGIHLNEFVIQLFHEKFEVFLASVSFDLNNETYSFGYMDDKYIDDYWMKDQKLFLDEEYGRIELDNYKFDDYIRDFGMDEANFEFSILEQQFAKADVKIYF